MPAWGEPRAACWPFATASKATSSGCLDAYREFNFSPSGEWAAYAFRSYREGAPFAISDPKIALRRSRGELELQASIPVDEGRLRVALSAVIEHGDGSLSYWALRHPAAKPDFHHPDAFALELD
jgi:hypothetical protein